jgi:hypothetical protein
MGSFVRHYIFGFQLQKKMLWVLDKLSLKRQTKLQNIDKFQNLEMLRLLRNSLHLIKH